MSEALIRPYEKRDRDGVLTLAADTAFFGDPLERYLDDRRLFCDGLYAYYTDFEPEHGWVACGPHGVVGFAMGCVSTAARRQLWLRHILPRVALGLVTGRYTIGTRTWRHAARAVQAAVYGKPAVDERKYPAHLHLNVHSAWRRRGIGRQLLQASLDQLRELRVPGVHLNTTSANAAAGKLYESFGFRVADSRPARQWAGLVAGEIHDVCYVRELP